MRVVTNIEKSVAGLSWYKKRIKPTGFTGFPHPSFVIVSMAETISNLTLSLAVKAEEGKLFGTVTANDLAEALAAKGITVDRKQISVEAIKTVGEYEATARLHKEVKATIKFSVTAAE